jgi:hypothetical protein
VDDKLLSRTSVAISPDVIEHGLDIDLDEE